MCSGPIPRDSDLICLTHGLGIVISKTLQELSWAATAVKQVRNDGGLDPSGSRGGVRRGQVLGRF